MTATDQLRKLLDERGVEYETNDIMGASEMVWLGHKAYQLTPNATLMMHPTPEQAIAATLGGNDKSRWFQLFGTPERAARTIVDRELGYRLMKCEDYDALLEWLEGGAE